MSAQAHIHQYSDKLYLISLPVPIKGFNDFIGTWVYKGNTLILVDVGPAVSVPELLAAMADLGLGAPELILLTHIHIDHAGGVGRVVAAFPQATVVCHPKGVQHLIDPQQLWQGSVNTLGDIARAYGPISPVAGGQIVAAGELDIPQIECIDTPGHAAHHMSYMMDGLLFAGEAGGVSFFTPDQVTYMRPATPPRFYLETCLESIDRLITKRPQHICYGHLGQRGDAVARLQSHRFQLSHWLEWIRSFYKDGSHEGPMDSACADYLLANDPLLKGFFSLSADIQARERNFIHNSIKGYLGYLDRSASPAKSTGM